MSTEGTSLDAGALIAIEAGVRRVLALVDETLQLGQSVHVVSGVIAQVGAEDRPRPDSLGC